MTERPEDERPEEFEAAGTAGTAEDPTDADEEAPDAAFEGGPGSSETSRQTRAAGDRPPAEG